MGKKQLSGAQKRKKKKEREELALEMERLKLGPTKLWTGLVTHHKDVFVSHVISKLNRTDRFLFSDVNSESRGVLAYAGVDVSKLGYAVHECSSISTLEWAWNNMPWGKKGDSGSVLDQAWFCSGVAFTNKLDLLKWAREEEKCEWGSGTIDAAAYQANLEMVKYCVANECPINDEACALAAENGHLEVLKYLREEAQAPWDWRTATFAAKYGHLHILEYLVERKFDQDNGLACVYAAENGHLDCLKYLHETAKWPWLSHAVREAHENDHPDCVQYLLDNNCPLPPGWRYEHGVLHTQQESSSSSSSSSS